MFDRIKNTLRVAVKEWRTGEQGHRRYTEVMAEREAARQAAFASLSATAKDTIRLGSDATDDQLAAALAEIEQLPDAQMFEAAKALCSANCVTRVPAQQFAMCNSSRFSAIAKMQRR